MTPTEESVFTAAGVEISGPGGVAPSRTDRHVEVEPPGSSSPVNHESQEADGEEEEELSGPDDVSWSDPIQLF